MTRDPLELAREVVRGEAAAVAALESRLGGSFVQAVETLHGCRGKVVVSGVGKSGLLAHKLAATLTSNTTQPTSDMDRPNITAPARCHGA